LHHHLGTRKKRRWGHINQGDDQVTEQTKAQLLLERLATDDEFRARMEHDPIGAFADYGFVIDPKIAPARVTLPSKQDIKANADLLAQQLDATSGWVVFCR
jgi:putative modified peptide